MSNKPCGHVWVMVSTDTPMCSKCRATPSLWVVNKGVPDVLYTAQPHQIPYHESSIPNLLMIGPRGSGKTLAMRMNAHMRAMAIPGYTYLIMRRTTPELKKSHLIYIDNEMQRLGGDYHHTDMQAKYPNGSIGFFGHMDNPRDAARYLSAQYDEVIPDEIVTFTGEQILKIASCVRVTVESGRVGMLRGGMNKLGVGAEFVKKYFVDKTVSPEENDDYRPEEWGVIAHRFSDNAYIDQEQYRRRLAALPEHVRKAWLDDEWVIEGAYFPDFRPSKDGKPWHVIHELPTVQGQPLLDVPWVSIYRAIDWGYDPDPATCLWIAVLPSKRHIIFKERRWRRTLAADVALAIKHESEGMRIVETKCDPTMLIEDGKGEFSIGDIFERNGIPLTPSQNKRDVYGYAIHNALNTEIQLGNGETVPMLQILADTGYLGCPNLIRTIPQAVVDSKDPNKLGDGDDHEICAAAYHFMGQGEGRPDPVAKAVMPWMLPRHMRKKMN